MLLNTHTLVQLKEEETENTYTGVRIHNYIFIFLL